MGRPQPDAVQKAHALRSGQAAGTTPDRAATRQERRGRRVSILFARVNEQ